mmetsp:Transcript_17984/g.12917  ORF Transcript_17984/g.12917 Transcript_17984/m.12917 type:complete len:131 (+) Transcript_17984:327-719(+)
MGALHIAVSRTQPAVIELLLMNSEIDIDLLSPLHGTPLHTACRGSSVKIVQQLLLSNANINIKNAKNKTPKEVTKNQRIIYLIEKYEKRNARSSFSESSSNLNSQQSAGNTHQIESPTQQKLQSNPFTQK